MVLGIGTDIIEIERIKKACSNSSFREKCYTEAELNYAGNRDEALAGSFAVKEAVAKALGTGFRGFGTKDIECIRDDWGKPYAVLYNGALERYNAIGGKNIFVSISHSKENAIAFAVIEGE